MTSHGQYISQPVKYLGKLYVDRMPNNRPDQALLFKAVAIIQRQAPPKGKPQLAFFTTREVLDKATGTIKPAALCGRLRDGTLSIVQPMITVVSIGHTNKAFVYVTVEPKENDNSGMLRFWIYAFSCKSKEMGVKLATHMISCCSAVRNMYRQRRAQGQRRARMSRNANAELPIGAAPAYGANDTTMMEADSSKLDGQEIDISLALEAAAQMYGGAATNAPNSGDEPFKNTMLNDDEFSLATDAMNEMYDLDCALKMYRLPEAFRSKLMDAFQKGYSEGGSITQKCNGNPAEVMANSAMVRV